MSDLLFATPWWLFGSLIIVGGIVFRTGLQRRQNTPMYVGIALVLLAVGLKTLSYFVETDKEKCTRQTNELVASVQSHDWVKFTSLLEDDVGLNTSAGPIFSNRDQLVAAAKNDTDAYHLTNVAGHVTDVEQDQAGITVDIDASSEQNATMGFRVPSSWKLTWERDGKAWRLHEITCTKIGNSNVNEMAHLIAR